MAAQVSTNYANLPIVRGGAPYILDSETLLQDAARATALAQFTVMAQVASTRKWVPLTSVDPTLTFAYMTCGAVGGSQAAFAAVSDGSFQLSVDGVAISITGLDFTDLPSVLDTRGKMVCGAVGGSQAAFAAVSDGAFKISIDGTEVSLTALDFTGLPSVLDTRATGVCAANGTNLAGWQAVTDGSVAVTINGTVTTKTAINFSGITTLDDIEDVLNDAFIGEDIEWLYDDVADVFSYQTKTVGATSTLTVLSTGGAGTDISASGFLNGTAATLVQGTGHDGYYAQIADVINHAAAGRFTCTFDGDEFTFYSITEGATSSASVLTAGASGTDISGASYLNGLTGTGTATAGTGHDGYYAQIADVINHAALGRFLCTFDGDEFRFQSPTPGVNGAVTVLTAGAAGTDISGASYLNGLTGTGTATAGSGSDGTDLPLGIFWGDAVAAASLVAGDVTGQQIMIGGQGVILDEDQITLENSLATTDVVVARAETIASVLQGRGIYLQATRDISAYQS